MTIPRPSPARLLTAILLAATAALYTLGTDRSGWDNSFYAAAAQAGPQSWHAFFFGASDAAGTITVDKPPASIWVMRLSVRLFGLSSWSLLVPEALMGVAAVALLVATVRRVAGAVGGSARRPAARSHAGAHVDGPRRRPRRPAHRAAGGRRLEHHPGARRRRLRWVLVTGG